MELSFVVLLFVASSNAFLPEDSYYDDIFSNYHSPSFSKRTMDRIGAEIFEVPFIAVIYADDSFVNYPFSTGVIISDYWVLTTAKPLYIQKGKMMRVLTGMSNVFRIRELPFNPVERYIVHHEYTPDEVYNDIAVVKVQNRFTYGNTRDEVQIMLPGALESYQTLNYDKVNITVYGFGGKDQESRGILKKSVIPVNSKVVDFQQDLFIAAHGSVRSCYGDSGSPGLVDGKLVGLLIVQNGCENRNYPNIFTGVMHYYEWIMNAIRSEYF